MPIIQKQKVGGLTFIRIHAFRKNWVFSYCQTKKTHVIYA